MQADDLARIIEEINLFHRVFASDDGQRVLKLIERDTHARQTMVPVENSVELARSKVAREMPHAIPFDTHGFIYRGGQAATYWYIVEMLEKYRTSLPRYESQLQQLRERETGDGNATD